MILVNEHHDLYFQLIRLNMPVQLTHNQISNPQKTFPLVVICEDMTDPRNVGMAFRVCEAMGVAKLYLVGKTPTPPHKKISRTARSTEQWLAFEYWEDPAELLAKLKADGYGLCGLEITDESTSIKSYPFSQLSPIALIVGAEQNGITAATLEKLDQTVHIDMYGRNTSMNVITALSICLYEIGRQLEAS